MTDIKILGVPLDLGASRRGTDMGPSALRLTGVAARLAALGHAVEDLGNIDVPIAESSDIGDPTQRFATTIAGVCAALAQRTRAAVAANAVPLVFGGDHSIAMGAIGGVAAAQRAAGRTIGVIWVDAHADMNTPETTPSGNVHGMPLAAVQGKGPPLLTETAAAAAAIAPANVVLLGIRDLDPREKELVRQSGVTAITMADIDRDGMAAAAAQALAAAGAGTAGVYLSVDMDGIDPSIAPGVGTPVRGGLTYRESHLLMELVADSERLIGADIVEINPSLDERNATAELAAELVLSLFGRRIL